MCFRFYVSLGFRFGILPACVFLLCVAFVFVFTFPLVSGFLVRCASLGFAVFSIGFSAGFRVLLAVSWARVFLYLLVLC